MPKTSTNKAKFLSVLLTALGVLSVVIPQPRDVSARSPALQCQHEFKALTNAALNRRGVSEALVQRLTDCLKDSAKGPTPRVQAASPDVQQFLEGCFAFFADSPIIAWYAPLGPFGGQVFIGNSGGAYPGVYFGYPLIASVGTVNMTFGSWSIFTLGGLAVILTGGSEPPAWIGVWFPECGIEPPI